MSTVKSIFLLREHGHDHSVTIQRNGKHSKHTLQIFRMTRNAFERAFFSKRRWPLPFLSFYKRFYVMESLKNDYSKALRSIINVPKLERLKTLIKRYKHRNDRNALERYVTQGFGSQMIMVTEIKRTFFCENISDNKKEFQSFLNWQYGAVTSNSLKKWRCTKSGK